ncbi:hypothetical protein DPMN_183070 [Dreissena polymorpha]|uniref:Uncharacterized protein n=1 Tax=Dreissena polymorpha TaxID=45954 RepID=A0A9D4DJB8_DREPO|nr:hypothetical protein DPMN_183070 [Dreissena polymorpha]
MVEYFSDLYTYPRPKHCNLLQNDPRPESDNESLSIPMADVEMSVRSLKTGKYPGVDTSVDHAQRRGNGCCNDGPITKDLGGEEVAQGMDLVTGNKPCQGNRKLCEITAPSASLVISKSCYASSLID